MSNPRILGIHMEHPSAADRMQGVSSKAVLAVDRGLKSGKVDAIPLDERALVNFIHDASKALMILRNIAERGA